MIGETQGWRIVIFTVLPTTPPMIDQIAREMGHRIVGVLTTQGPSQRRSEGFRAITAWAPPSVDVIVSNFPKRWAHMLEPLRPDLIICAGFPWKIPADVLDLPRLGAINLHPAKLPKYRGPGSMVASWLFLNDEHETAWTIHRIEEEFDTGPILVQKVFPIYDDDDVETLFGRNVEAVPPAFREAFEALAQGEQGTPQNLDEGFYVEWLTEDERTVDWSESARSVHNRVRAWHGLEIPRGAFGQIDGSPVLLTRTHLIDATEWSSAEPGTVLCRSDERLVIQCGDAPLEILEWSGREIEAVARHPVDA